MMKMRETSFGKKLREACKEYEESSKTADENPLRFYRSYRRVMELMGLGGR